MINKFKDFKKSIESLIKFLDENFEKEINTQLQIEFDLISRNYWENFDLIREDGDKEEINKLLFMIKKKKSENERISLFWDEITKKSIARVKKEKTFN